LKDVHALLREKEQEIERVQREIAALLVVIPLLEDEPSASELSSLRELSSPHDATFAATPDYESGLDDLNVYYPFTRRAQEGA
jgi:hypothetical protein